MNNIKVGSKVAYCTPKWTMDHYGKVIEIFENGVNIQFDERWHWSMDDKNTITISFPYRHLIKINERIYSEIDPYGEENWDE